MTKLPTYEQVAHSLEENGEAEYVGHKIKPALPFGYTTEGDTINGDFGDLEKALHALRSIIQEPTDGGPISMTPYPTHTCTVDDASNKTEREVRVKFDPHGLVVEIDGSNESIIIDLDNDQLRVFHSDGYENVSDGHGNDGKPAFVLTLNVFGAPLEQQTKYASILKHYSMVRDWDKDTQHHLLLTFLEAGGGDLNAFVQHLNRHIDEERRATGEDDSPHGYPLNPLQMKSLT